MTKLNGTVLLFHSKRLAVITEPVQVKARAKDIEVLVNPAIDELVEAVKVFKDYYWQVSSARSVKTILRENGGEVNAK